MPEGHVLHRIAAQLNTDFVGRTVMSTSPQGRFAASAERINGTRFAEASAWGKHLFVEFEGIEGAVDIHLGLLGKFFFTYGEDPASIPEVGAIRWRLAAYGTGVDSDRVGSDRVDGGGVDSSDHERDRISGSLVMDLRGPNLCELRTSAEIDAVTAKLGPDPLRSDADPDRAWNRIARTATPMAALLMDQRVFAGVGNIYRAEVLFRHQLDPMMPGKFLRKPEFEGLWTDLCELMSLGVRDGRIDTVRDEHSPAAQGRDPRIDAHGGEVYVYRRAGQPCLVCHTPIAQKEFAGRNLFWCPRCQPRHRRRRANP